MRARLGLLAIATATVAVAAVGLSLASDGNSNDMPATRERTDLQPTGDPDDVQRVTSLTATDLPRSTVRDVTQQPSPIQRTDELRTELGAEQRNDDAVVVVPGDVLFGFDEAHVRDRARPVLADVAELIGYSNPTTVRIQGHTDAIGPAAYNQQLSERRAQAVADALVTDYGIDPDRVDTAGFGQRRPLAPNQTPDGRDNPQGRAKNRRVEIILEQ